MSSGLLLSALLLGLAGIPHCLTMCTAPCQAMARRCSAAPDGADGAAAALHLGRMTGYALAGAMVAASVGAMASLSQHVAGLRPLWVMAQAGVVVFGGWLLATGRLPGNWRVPSNAVARFGRKGPLAAFGIGMGWAVLPCAQLYAGLMLAAMASGAPGGALVALAFAVPGTLALWIAPRWMGALLARLRTQPQATQLPVHFVAARADGVSLPARGRPSQVLRSVAWDVALIRLGGVSLMASAGWMLWRSAQAGWQIVCAA